MTATVAKAKADPARESARKKAIAKATTAGRRTGREAGEGNPEGKRRLETVGNPDSHQPDDPTSDPSGNGADLRGRLPVKKKERSGYMPDLRPVFQTKPRFRGNPRDSGRTTAKDFFSFSPTAELGLGMTYSGQGAWAIARHAVMKRALKTQTLNRYGFTIPWDFAESGN